MSGREKDGKGGRERARDGQKEREKRECVDV